eukprot:TRINITY_DN10054_c0_g4_i1.p1 TRINITY_DN10054_c0_g4~~TRINITY_DN10054_c0_g4_i1.p1  ORF type:complete len:617 (+),score=125.72 TRINITY_DN10054_c0_g4_i1:81-1931(+)
MCIRDRSTQSTGVGFSSSHSTLNSMGTAEVLATSCSVLFCVLPTLVGLLASIGYQFYDEWEEGLVFSGCCLVYLMLLRDWNCCGGPGPYKPDPRPNPNPNKDSDASAMDKSAPLAHQEEEEEAGVSPASRPEDTVSGTSLAVCSVLATVMSFAMCVQWKYPAVRVFGLGVCTASTYGVINDIIACHCYCLEYFTNGHTPFHVRLIGSNSAMLNALVWGCYATWKLGLPLGLVLSYVARNEALSEPIPFGVLAAITGGIALLALIYAEVLAQRKMKQYPKSIGGWGPDSNERSEQELAEFFAITISPMHGYEAVELRLVPEKSRPGWMAVGERNGAGYTVMPVLAILLIVGIFLTRVVWTVVDKISGDCNSMWGAMCKSDHPVPGVMWTLYFVFFIATIVGIVVLIVFLAAMDSSMGRERKPSPKEHSAYLRDEIERLESQLSGNTRGQYGATLDADDMDDDERKYLEDCLADLRLELSHIETVQPVDDPELGAMNQDIKPTPQPSKGDDSKQEKSKGLDFAVPDRVLQQAAQISKRMFAERLTSRAIRQSVAGGRIVGWLAAHRGTLASRILQWRCNAVAAKDPAATRRPRAPDLLKRTASSKASTALIRMGTARF